MKNVFKFLPFVLIVISSCKKKDDDNIIVHNTNCIIGVPDASVTITDINPDTTITSWGAPILYPFDINADGINDFVFCVFNTYIFGGMVLSPSRLRIKTLNNDSYILADSIYPDVESHYDTIISQSTIDSLFPKILSLNDTINLTDNWRNGDLNILTSFNNVPEPFGNGHSFYQGAWKDADHKYIGLRYKNLLGWVEIGIPSNKYIKIYEFALSK